MLPLLLMQLVLPLGSSLLAQEERSGESSRDKIPRAYGHHDLALLLIKKGEYDQAASEAHKVLQLRLPPEYDRPVSQSVAMIADRLGEARRFDAAQTLLDDALKTLDRSSATNRASLLFTKARLYLKAGDEDLAIEAYRKALDLDSRK
jgi:tetratricopeptide (TPR) repeat protein